MLELFKTSKYDKNIIIDNYSVLSFKNIVARNIELIKPLSKNIVLLGDNVFEFIITFFSGLYAGKNLFLVQDRQKLKELNFKYDILNVELNETPFEHRDFDINAPLINFYTSGSTKTKCIQKSLSNLIEEARAIKRELNFKKNLKFATTSSPAHLFALTFFVFYPLVNIEDNLKIITKCILYPDKINLDDYALISTPAFLGAFEKYSIQFENPPEYVITAGAKLDDKIFSYLKRQTRVIEIYGSTETGVLGYRKTQDSDFCRFKDVEIEVFFDHAVVKTKFGYENEIKLFDNIELKENKIKIKGRLDRLIKIQEKRISPEDIERSLTSFDEIEDAYCFKYGEKIAAMCALSEKGKREIIKKGVVEFIKPIKKELLKTSEIVPQKWRLGDIVPKSASGKIDKNAIEDMFKLNLSLPIVLKRKESENSALYTLFFHKNCNFFKGHFEGFEIVAGVVELYIAQRFASNYFKIPLGAGQIKRIKFSNIIKAGDIIDLQLKFDDVKGIVQFTYFKDDIEYSRGDFPSKNIFDLSGGEADDRICL